jgi:hypothetical protein
MAIHQIYFVQVNAISRPLLCIAKPYCGMLHMADSYSLYEYLYAFYAFYITYA